MSESNGSGRAARAGASSSNKHDPKQKEMDHTLFRHKSIPQKMVDLNLEIRKLKVVHVELQKTINAICENEGVKIATLTAKHREELQAVQAQFCIELRASQEAEQRARDWMRVLGVEASALAPKEAAAAGAAGGLGARILADAPGSLEELDSATLGTLNSSALELLKQIARAQERLEVWEEVAQEIAELRCPISGTLMRDPVQCTDGNSYERKEITKWIKEQVRKSEPITSPLTREPMSSDFSSNRTLRNAISSVVEAKLGKRKRTD